MFDVHVLLLIFSCYAVGYEGFEFLIFGFGVWCSINWVSVLYCHVTYFFDGVCVHVLIESILIVWNGGVLFVGCSILYQWLN